MDILKLTFEDFKKRVREDYKRDRFLAASAYRQIFRFGDTTFENVKDMEHAPDFIKTLSENITPDLGQIVKKVETDGVIKFVTELKDKSKIESVIIPMFTHNTLCISSQVGCRMGCRFCETGKKGLTRDLTTEEIIAQYFNARFTLNQDIRNIVFMGMGEPLDNMDNVVKALEIISDPRGIDIPLTRVTLSTSGKVEGIKKLSSCKWAEKINLAVSLNATNDEIRSEIMPVNKKHKIEGLLNALKEFPLRTKGAIFVEYVLLKGINDSEEDAVRLANLLKDIKNQVNIIPYNPGKDSFFETPDEKTIEIFRETLVNLNVFVRRRATKGRSAMAACGQLS